MPPTCRLARTKGKGLARLRIEQPAGAGAGGSLLTVAEAGGESVASMAPNTWPRRGFKLADKTPPFYVDCINMKRCGCGGG